MVLVAIISAAFGHPVLSFLTFLSLLIGIAIAKLFYTADSRLHKLREVIPGPPQLPLLGNTHQLLIPQEEILPTFSKWFKEYGPRILYRVGSYWIVTIASAKDMEKLLTSTTETTKSVDYDLLIPWLGEGLLVSNGKKWTQRRKMLTSAFHFKILDQFVDVFDEQSKILVNILKAEFPNGESFDVSPFITRCTLEIICETAMGMKINAQMDRDTEYIHAIMKLLSNSSASNIYRLRCVNLRNCKDYDFKRISQPLEQIRLPRKVRFADLLENECSEQISSSEVTADKKQKSPIAHKEELNNPLVIIGDSGIFVTPRNDDLNSERVESIPRKQQIRALRPWLEPSIIWNVFSHGREEQRLVKILHDFTDKVIRERKSKFLTKAENLLDPQEPEDDCTGKGKKRLAFLDLMLEAQQNGENFSDEGIREETDTFMFGGHDTTAAAASFTIFLIGGHPEVQEKLHKELDEIFGTDRDRPVTPQDLSRLKYLECCIKESMRLCAPVPFIARSIQNDFELDKGVILPPGTLPMILPYQLHRDPEVYPEPEEYRPDRFFPENSVGRHPFAYLPFSAGPRNCIGQKFAMMEEKILLAKIFRNLRVESLEKLEDLQLLSDMILHSKSGINIKIFKR